MSIRVFVVKEKGFRLRWYDATGKRQELECAATTFAEAERLAETKAEELNRPRPATTERRKRSRFALLDNIPSFLRISG